MRRTVLGTGIDGGTETDSGISASLVDGRYQVESRIGRGGMGVVYRARDQGLDRRVALKLIGPSWSSDPESVTRFQHEARVLASVRSPYVVQVYAYGMHEGRCFFVMELVDGRALDAIILDYKKHGASVPIHRVLTILGRISEGLAAVHHAGVVHRDVKPSNLVIEEDTGRPVLVDFGLAFSERIPGSLSGGGTPAYMAPEQGRKKGPITARTDVYALGCTAFELLSGHPPFEGENDAQMAEMHAHAPIPAVSARRPELAPFDAVLRRALAKDPDDRYDGPMAMVNALAEASEPHKGAVVRPPSIPAPRQGALQVLIADRDPAFRKLATHAVELTFLERSIKIAAASTGPDALERAERVMPDLVLLDYGVTELDGVETLSRLRAMPGGSRVRVVVFSTEAGLLVSRWRFSILGVKDFVEKPVDLPVLVSILGNIADRSGWREELGTGE
ncbi:MAG: serine/threonine-protein kinase [Byssovorax sp.]